jgi:flagellar biosynthetic protein FliR
MTLKLEDAITAMALVGTRVSGLLVFAPVLGSSAIAPRIKAGLVVLITALLYPVCGPRDLSLSPAVLARVMLGEMLIGVLLGLAVQLVFDAAEFAGQLVGMQVGYSLVNVLDPNTQVETPVVSVFMQMLVTLLFLQMNVHHWLLRSLAASFRYLPAGSAAVNGQLVHALLHAAGGIWLAGVQLAAPVLIATMLADLVMGFLGKASPQLPVLFLGLSVKSMVGLSVLALSLRYWPAMFERYFTTSIHWAEELLQLAH